MFVVKKTSNELLYRCYIDTKNGVYYYSNLEMVDEAVYTSPNVAKSSSDLTLSTSWYVYQITEDELSVTDVKGRDLYTYNRYTAGDLYDTKSQLKTYALTKKQHKHYALIRRYAKHKVGDFNPSTYTVVGEPTITDAGIVSGCTKDKYLIIPKSFPANVTDLETVWKFNQGGWGGIIVSARESIDGYSNERSVHLDCAGWFHAYLSSNGTSYDISNNLHSSVLDYNVWYYGKLTYDGSTYNLYISTDNESWTLCDSVSSTKTLAPTDGNLLIGTNGADSLFNGSIDLSESYIKINGEYWWAGFYTENVYDEKYY